MLIDERDAGTSPRILFFLEHAIQDASLTRGGERRVVSKRLLFVEIDRDGTARNLNYAPYLDYRALKAEEPGLADILARPECAWIGRELEGKAQAHAIANVVPEHLADVRERKIALLDKTEACCARAESGHVAAAPPRSVMNSRRLMGSTTVLGP